MLSRTPSVLHRGTEARTPSVFNQMPGSHSFCVQLGRLVGWTRAPSVIYRGLDHPFFTCKSEANQLMAHLNRLRDRTLTLLLKIVSLIKNV